MTSPSTLDELAHRKVDRRRGLTDRAVARLGRDADDSPPVGVRTAEAEPLAQGILSRPQRLRRALADDGDGRAALPIGRLERAPPDQPDAQRPEVAIADDGQVEDRPFAWLPLCDKAAVPASGRASEWHDVDRRRRYHVRKGPELRQESVVERGDSLRRAERRLRPAQFDDGKPVGRESSINALELLERSPEQAGHEEGEDRGRDLEDDQRPLREKAAARRGRTVTAPVNRHLYATGEPERGQQAGSKCRRAAHQCRKSQRESLPAALRRCAGCWPARAPRRRE